jgi:hypothetical protein
VSADADRALRDAADGDGAACRWLRRFAVEVLEHHPLAHIGTLTTAALTGWRDGAWSERIVEATGDRVRAGTWRSAPLAPGVPVEIATGQADTVVVLTASSLPEPEPDADTDHSWDTETADDRLEGTTHQLLVPDLDALPADWKLSDRRRDRLVRNNHLDGYGHLRYRAALDDRTEQRRYADWLTASRNHALRGCLPAEPDRLEALLTACARRLGDYPALLACWDGWVMRRDHLERLLATDHLNHYDLADWAATLLRAEPGRSTSRTCSVHLTAYLERRREPDKLRRGLAWPATLFATNHYLAERLSDGPGVWRPRRTRTAPVQVAYDDTLGLAGRWQITGLTPDQAGQLAAAHREALAEPAATQTGTVEAPAPCEIERVLTAEEFSTGTLGIRNQLDAGEPDGRVVVDVRADATLAARVGADIACRGECLDPSTTDVRIHWPAPIKPGTRLRGEAQQNPKGEWLVRLIAYPPQET